MRRRVWRRGRRRAMEGHRDGPGRPGRRRRAVDGPDDRLDLAGAEDDVDFRGLAFLFIAMSLGQAPRPDELPAAACGLVLAQLENRVDRLLLGPVDERAGV